MRGSRCVGLRQITVLTTICVMAKNVTVITTDDIDGSEGAARITFGLDGTTYEIDLGPENRAKLKADLDPFIKAARRAGGGGRGRGRANGRSPDRVAVRAWAREAGLQVSDRGRISADIIRQYEAIH